MPSPLPFYEWQFMSEAAILLGSGLVWQKLHKAGAARLGTDESVFNAVFVSQSFQQLRAVFGAYKRLYNKDMEKVIKSEMSGDLERGMKTIGQSTTLLECYTIYLYHSSQISGVFRPSVNCIVCFCNIYNIYTCIILYIETQLKLQ